MRPSHILAALGATITTLAQAQDTSPNPEQQAAQSTQGADCNSTTTTWSLPSTSATATHPANFTITVDHSPANGTATAASSGILPPIITTTGTGSTTAASVTPSSSSSVAAAAAAGEGLASDSSMLGLVIFFALSLCLL